ncbi:MAG: hypothetical protein ACE367_17830 [Acidimicrobiales bacterium]
MDNDAMHNDLMTNDPMANVAMQRAVDFIRREGRILERRILDTVVDGRPAHHVTDALLAYRNDDGGFGHGLEPDKRAPTSQPLDTEVAWQSLDWAGLSPADLEVPAESRAAEFVWAACDHLASIGDGVGCLTPGALDHPHAGHWAYASPEPDLNPTAGLVGFLWQWSIDHPWRAAATSFCWSALADGPPDDAHAVIGVLRFLEHVPERERADAVADEIRERLPRLAWLHFDAGADDYGVTPLQLVPDPAGRYGDLVPADVRAAHLDRLERTQADDGGWEIDWPTIGPAAVAEWRGRRTLENLLLLRAGGRWG